ncbi:CpaF family protein [Cupriavidus pauculus]|nr:CpaF family protein [Cupriavidus pauculus]
MSMFFESLAPLRAFLCDPDVTEVMVNSPDNIWIEMRGVMTRVAVCLTSSQIEGAIRSLAASVQKSAVRGSAQGIVHAAHHGLRIAAVMHPSAVDGHALSIRRHREARLSLDDYMKAGAMVAPRDGAGGGEGDVRRPHIRDALPCARTNATASADLAVPATEPAELKALLSGMVRSRRSILVAGGTSTGKTTFLNALIGEVPSTERVLSIEDTTELNISVPNRVRLLSNADHGVTAQHLIALSLRFRPDRILVGEVRGGEAFDLLQALNTGHEGGMASIHANNARSALTRLESLAMLGLPDGSRWTINDMRRLIAECFDAVIHMRRAGEHRYISEVAEIHGIHENEYRLLHRFRAHAAPAAYAPRSTNLPCHASQF